MKDGKEGRLEGEKEETKEGGKGGRLREVLAKFDLRLTTTR